MSLFRTLFALTAVVAGPVVAQQQIATFTRYGGGGKDGNCAALANGKSGPLSPRLRGFVEVFAPTPKRQKSQSMIPTLPLTSSALHQIMRKPSTR